MPTLAVPRRFDSPALAVFLLCLSLVIAACGGTTDLNGSTSTGLGGAGGSSGPGQGGSSIQTGAGGTAGQVGSTGGSAAAGKGGGAHGGKNGGLGGNAAGGNATGGTGVTTGGAAGAPAGGNGGQATLSSIEVAPTAVTIAPGTSTKLVATALYSDGSKLDVTAAAAWSTSAPSLAVVTAGQITGVAAGTAQVTAAYMSKSATATITISSATPKSLVISPSKSVVGINATTSLAATLLLSDGSSQDVTKTATWSSSSTGVASVDGAGVVTGVSAGTATITAGAAGLTGTADVAVNGAALSKISVTPTDPTVGIGLAINFLATGTYSDGSVADVTAAATWASSDFATVAIQGGGLGQSVAAGTSIVSATLGAITGATTVTVTNATLTSITVSPAMAKVAIKGTTPLHATATFSDGSTNDATTSVTWSAPADGIASVSNAAGTQGIVTGIGAGTSTVTATLGALSGSAQVTVVAAKLTSITIAPGSATLGKGTTASLIATGVYDDGTMVDVTEAAAWTSTDGTIAGVSNAPGAGVVTAVSPGSMTITATLSGVSGQAMITVTPATVLSITVAPAALTLAIGKKQNLTATAVYTDGTMVDVTQLAAWTTGDATIADVSNATGGRGIVSAIGDGTIPITATFQGASGASTVTVTEPSIASLQVSPIDPSRAVGQNQQFQAIAIFTSGTQQNVTGQSAWSSSMTNVATIGTNGGTTGRADALAPGATTITASYKGITGQTTLTVTAATLVEISVSPIDPTLAAGVKAQFQATAIFSDGTSQQVTGGSTWQSSDTTVAQVQTNGGQKGRVTAIAAGVAQISATYMGLTGSSNVTVSGATIVSIGVSPTVDTVAVGTKVAFEAQAIYSDGSSMPITAQSTWTSDAQAVADVQTAGGAKGLASALSAGTAHIQATYMGLTGSATLTVTAATVTQILVSPPEPSTGVGVKVKLFAEALLSDGSSMDVTNQSTWTSAQPGIADVSDGMGSKGLVSPIAPGDAVISATFQGMVGTTTVHVKMAKLVAVQVTPFHPTLPVGYVTAFQATGLYDDQSTQDLTAQATWTSDAMNVAPVSDAQGSKGRVSPILAGNATIKAQYAGVVGSSAVTVTSATLQSIAIGPPSPQVAAGQSLQLTATGDFGGGLLLDITSYVTWLSSNTAVADVSNAPNSHGLAAGFTSGTTTISALRDGKTGTTTLTVP